MDRRSVVVGHHLFFVAKYIGCQTPFIVGKEYFSQGLDLGRSLVVMGCRNLFSEKDINYCLIKWQYVQINNQNIIAIAQ